MQQIQNITRVTSKGQITLPKFVRQALGLETGSKLSFTLKDGVITVDKAEEFHADPAIFDFLQLIENDIRQGKNISHINSELAKYVDTSLTCEDIENLEFDDEINL